MIKMENKDNIVYKNKFKSINEIFNINHQPIIIAGPCSIESLKQMELIASIIKKEGLRFMRGGAFKPRTSPYSFQGLGIEGLKIFDYIRKKYDLFAVSEIVDPRDVEIGIMYTDMIQIGSRNMQNYSLLKEIGKTKHPVLLKRGMSSTIEEYLFAAEYIVSNGNTNLVLCERGIRSFNDTTRNLLDVAAIALIKLYTTLPIIADVSHSLGRTDIILPLAKASLISGADGIMLEIHECPEKAFSDESQHLNCNKLYWFINGLKSVHYFDNHETK